MGMFGSKDIVLDEAAFEKASGEYKDIAVELQNLRNDIEAALDRLKNGFNTPAGAKFISTCQGSLLKPLEQQKKVIEHVSENLETAKDKYSSVFREYESLNTTIKSYEI